MHLASGGVPNHCQHLHTLGTFPKTCADGLDHATTKKGKGKVRRSITSRSFRLGFDVTTLIRQPSGMTNIGVVYRMLTTKKYRMFPLSYAQWLVFALCIPHITVKWKSHAATAPLSTGYETPIL